MINFGRRRRTQIELVQDLSQKVNYLNMFPFQWSEKLSVLLLMMPHYDLKKYTNRRPNVAEHLSGCFE